MAKRGMNMTVSDQAIHLDIIAKSRGISAAESYFMDLPEASKNHLCYGALFNCYCKELLTEKAEALMEKMKELRFNTSSMAYNSLMTLYSKTGQPERIPTIIQEMKANNVMPDSYTYNVWMRALAAGNDISGVERVIEEMKRDGRVAGDWTTYSNLASIYVDAGLFEKAEKALKELEKRNDCQNLTAYQFLITLYGRTGNLLEVYRIWRSLRLAFPKTANISYLNMIQALVNLKDLPGAEKTFREWESGRSTYDIRIANALIGAYAKDGKLEQAEELKERARRSGAKPNVKTWELFLDYYLKSGDMNLAVDCVTNAIQTGRGDGRKWTPSKEVVQTLMSHFEKERDVEGAEAFVENLKKVEDEIEAETFESLIRTYAAAGKTSSSMRRRLKMENVEVNEEAKKLLEVVCVE
ncbi:Pentatricopeptide repeat [Macleaya cordata]|uniref:Pentatricopeptide repeat n=1 Tax=Macleaya cordata TaxID=56857 RepID=A0A200RDJ3_MACCD|nr:Pentatricopeptide repeat [Macleaya cordata]